MINRKEFVDKLKACVPGIDKKEIVNQGNYFVFKGGKCITHNSDLAIFQPVPEIDFDVAVKADELFKVLSKMKALEININLTDESKLCVSTKRTKTYITADHEISLPFESFLTEVAWKPLCDSFIYSLHSSAQVTSKDIGNDVLRFVYVDGDQMYATDGFKFMSHHLKAEYNEMFIPTESIKHLTTFKPVSYFVDEGWLYFQNEVGAVMILRTIFDEEYPANEFEELFDFEGEEVDIRQDMVDILNIAEIFAEVEDGHKTVHVSTKEGVMVVTGTGFSGTHKERVKINSTAEVEFDIDTSFFKEAIKLWSTMVVGTSWVKIEGDGFKYAGALGV